MASCIIYYVSSANNILLYNVKFIYRINAAAAVGGRGLTSDDLFSERPWHALGGRAQPVFAEVRASRRGHERQLARQESFQPHHARHQTRQYAARMRRFVLEKTCFTKIGS